jgi:hypothetical protein
MRTELRHWRSWRPWLLLLGLSVPAFFVARTSTVLGFAAGLSGMDVFLQRLLTCLAVCAVIISWGIGFTAAHSARRFAMLAMPLLAALALAQLCFQILSWREVSRPAGVALGLAGFAVLSILPGCLGWRMGWTSARLSLPVIAATSALLLAVLIWARATLQAEWAGLALLTVCAWPVVYAARVSYRFSPAPR